MKTPPVGILVGLISIVVLGTLCRCCYTRGVAGGRKEMINVEIMKTREQYEKQELKESRESLSGSLLGSDQSNL